MQMYFDKYGLDSKFVNERLSAFSIHKRVKILFEQLFAQHTIDLERLIWLVLGNECK